MEGSLTTNINILSSPTPVANASRNEEKNGTHKSSTNIRYIMQIYTMNYVCAGDTDVTFMLLLTRSFFSLKTSAIELKLQYKVQNGLSIRG